MPDLLTAYSRHLDLLYSSVIADVLDKFGQRNSALPCEVRPLRPTWRLFGRARTLAMTAARAMPEKPYALELQCIDGLQPGDVLVAAELAEEAFPRALEKVIGENKVREELAQGRSVQEVFAEYGIL